MQLPTVLESYFSLQVIPVAVGIAVQVMPSRDNELSIRPCHNHDAGNQLLLRTLGPILFRVLESKQRNQPGVDDIVGLEEGDIRIVPFRLGGGSERRNA